MIYVVDLIKANKKFSEKSVKKSQSEKNYVVKQLFGGLKICICHLFRRVRLPQLKTP